MLIDRLTPPLPFKTPYRNFQTMRAGPRTTMPQMLYLPHLAIMLIMLIMLCASKLGKAQGEYPTTDVSRQGGHVRDVRVARVAAGATAS